MRILRSLWKSPWFTIVAVMTLALGIGINTAIFSVVDAVLLQPLSYRDAGRIVSVDIRWADTGRETLRLAGGDVLDLQASRSAFEAFAYYFGGELGVQLGRKAEFTGTYLVTPDFFSVFGLPPAFGAVVSRGFAERNYGRAEAAVGRRISVEGQAYSIAAVAPAGFSYPEKANVWLPAPVTPENQNRNAYNYRGVAKLKNGVSLREANALLATVSARLQAAYPNDDKNKVFLATPLRDRMVGNVRSTLYFIMGAVALVLLISCANVANLLLARATARGREIAVRAALGASRWRIVRQLLAENLLVAALAGLVGLAFAYGGIGLLQRFAPENLPRMNEVRLNGSVLLFTSAVSLLASVLFGMVPAWQASRADLNMALKQGASRGMVGHGSHRFRSALVVAEVAMSVMLAIGAGLLFRSFIALTTVDVGFQSGGVLVMYAHAPAQSLPEYLGVGRQMDALLAELRSLPGVRSTAAAMGLPAGQYGSNGMYAVEGRHTFAPGQNLPSGNFSLASPAYFETVGIPLRRGRAFAEGDVYEAPFVAVISESLAREQFPHEDPIGRRLACGLDSPKWMTVVGVAGDVRQQSPASKPVPTIYMPLRQHPYHANEFQVVVRTSVSPASLVSAVRQTTQRANPDIALRFTTLDDMVTDSIATPRFRAFLVSAFAMLALLLAMAGVYGVMTYITTERTSELGLRMALGASSGAILRSVLGRALALTSVGLLIGAALALAAGRVIASLLFGLQPGDATTYAGALFCVGLVAVLASAIPAWRATQIEPLAALREE